MIVFEFLLLLFGVLILIRGLVLCVSIFLESICDSLTSKKYRFNFRGVLNTIMLGAFFIILSQYLEKIIEFL